MLHKETLVKEPLRRADALKSLTEMSVDEIYPWLFGIVKTACHDMNPYVRQTAMTGLLKIKELTAFTTAEYIDELTELINRGLKDRSSAVRSQALLVGSLMIEPREVFLEMLHPIFSRIVSDLHKLEHLPAICGLLAQYADRFLPDPASPDFRTLQKGVKTALTRVMEPYQIITLADLLC